MNRRKTTSDFSNKRLLSWDETQVYCGMGHTSVRDFGESVDAIKRYGRRGLFDRIIIDQKLSEGTNLK